MFISVREASLRRLSARRATLCLGRIAVDRRAPALHSVVALDRRSSATADDENTTDVTRRHATQSQRARFAYVPASAEFATDVAKRHRRI